MEELTPSQQTRVSQLCLCSGPRAARKSEKAVTGRLPFPEPRLPRGNQPRAPLALRASRVVCLRGAFDSARALCSAALTVMITQHH